MCLYAKKMPSRRFRDLHGDGLIGLIGQELSRNNLMWTYTFCTTTNGFHERGPVTCKSHRDICVLQNLIYDSYLVVNSKCGKISQASLT